MIHKSGFIGEGGGRVVNVIACSGLL